jgi:hypothetical protein
MAKRLRNAGRPAPPATHGPATLTAPPQVSALPVARIPRHGTFRVTEAEGSLQAAKEAGKRCEQLEAGIGSGVLSP